MENERLQEQIDQMFEEFEIVDWYIKVMEDGKNTKTLLRDYIKAQAEIKELKDRAVKKKAQYAKKLTKVES